MSYAAETWACYPSFFLLLYVTEADEWEQVRRLSRQNIDEVMSRIKDDWVLGFEFYSKESSRYGIGEYAKQKCNLEYY